jgi:protein MpaA
LAVPRPALPLFLTAALAAGCGSAHLTLSASHAADAERLSTRGRTAMPPNAESHDAAGERAIPVGRSLRGRTIAAQVLGPDSAPHKILLVGCIHGNECAGIRILSALARLPTPAGIQLWLVPEMNPDGTAAGTRQNAHGVDLNRNFPYHWQPVSDPIYYSGPYALSEPETRAAVGLIRRTKPVVTIWYHQHEDLVDMAGGDRGIARRYAELAGLRATCLPFLPGTASSWSNHTFPGTTAFVVELPAGAVGPAALRRHLQALRGLELGERVGSRTGCGP